MAGALVPLHPMSVQHRPSWTWSASHVLLTLPSPPPVFLQCVLPGESEIPTVDPACLLQSHNLLRRPESGPVTFWNPPAPLHPGAQAEGQSESAQLCLSPHHHGFLSFPAGSRGGERGPRSPCALPSHCIGPGLAGAVPLPRWTAATYLVGQGLWSAPWPALPTSCSERGGCSITRGPCPLPLPSLCLWGTPRGSTWPRQSRVPPDKVEHKERWPDWPWP